MTDIAAIYNDTSYHNAIDKLWTNMVTKKIYVTGGIGAKHEGESFGENYELPNLTAYNETCAAIGSVYWNQRLFMLTGEVKYYDVIERTLYNGLISGLSLDGQKFFYPNALESDGVYKFNIGECSRQSWFDCSCCPTNLIRFLPAVPGLIYATQSDSLYVNLYASNQAIAEVNGKKISIKQETNYPWNGKVKITVTSEVPSKLIVKLRIPGWTRGEVLPGGLYSYRTTGTKNSIISLNDEVLEINPSHGYFELNREWKGTETITLDFPMEVKEVIANEKVTEDRGKTSLEYGPLIYAFEEIDNKGLIDKISITGNEHFSVNKISDLLEGVNVLTVENGNATYNAIPYYSWSNRGVGKMKVWVPKSNE
jgi:DUF1680 family protein